VVAPVTTLAIALASPYTLPRPLGDIGEGTRFCPALAD
jgi:hypothetical protein